MCVIHKARVCVMHGLLSLVDTQLSQITKYIPAFSLEASISMFTHSLPHQSLVWISVLREWPVKDFQQLPIPFFFFLIFF